MLCDMFIFLRTGRRKISLISLREIKSVVETRNRDLADISKGPPSPMSCSVSDLQYT